MEPKGIVRAMGGYMAVGNLCGVSESAVKRWSYLGIIPEEYWSKFLRHPACKPHICAQDLHTMNEKARRAIRKEKRAA